MTGLWPCAAAAAMVQLGATDSIGYYPDTDRMRRYYSVAKKDLREDTNEDS